MKVTDVINSLKLIRQTKGNIKVETRNKDGIFRIINSIEIKDSEDVSKKTGKNNKHVYFDVD
jgi:flagellar basal body rod protein FlgF